MKKLLGLLFFLATQSHAFTLNNAAGAHFNSDVVTIRMASTDCLNLGVSKDEIMNMTIEGVQKFWNPVASSRLELVRGETKDVAATFRTSALCVGGITSPCDPNPDLVYESDIIIGCNANLNNFNSTSILALTLPNNVEGETINSALVLINDRPGNVFGNLSRNEMVAVLAHEIGHAFGLGHSEFESALMYFTPINDRERLGQDDVEGITYLYPKQVKVLGESTCGTLAVGGDDPPSGNFLALMLFGLGISTALAWAVRAARARFPKAAV